MTRIDNKPKRQIQHIIALLVLLPVILTLVSCREIPEELRLVVNELPVNQAIGAAMATAASRHGTPLRMLDVHASGSAAIEMLLSGTADVALVENTTAFNPGIRSLLPVYPGVLHVAFRSGFNPGEGAESVAGARIYAGNESALSNQLVRRFLEILDLSVEDVQFTQRQDDNLPDVIAIFGPLASMRVDLLQGFKLYSLDSPENIGRGSSAEGVRASYPQIKPYIIPRTTYPGLTTEPVLTLAVEMILVARADTDPRLIYRLIEQLRNSRTELASQFPALFDGMNGNFDPDSLNFSLHEGADRYRHRDEPSVYEQYAEVADAGLTIFLAVLSGGFALMRFLRIRRKNRIDHYYTELMAIRSAGLDMPLQENSEAQARVAQIEQEAVGLLVDEKLAADDSFRIFLTLSDAVMRDLKNDALRLRA